MSHSANSLSPNSARGVDTAKKVPLPPGRSFMDWTRKAPKITPRRDSITEEELTQHNTEQDCWIAVNGIVYDVTAYVGYHPGGRDQILRGAGTDATELFNDYHPWVNAQGILKTCIVGKLSFIRGFKMPFAPAMNSLGASGPVRTSFASSSSEVTIKPFFDWLQDDDFVHMFVTINQKMVLRPEYVTIIYDANSNDLKSYVYINELCFCLAFKLANSVKTISYQIENNKNVKITLEKAESKLAWKKIGSSLAENKSFVKVQSLTKTKFPVYLKKKDQLTHDTYLFTFRHEENTLMDVPIGRHVHIVIPDNQSLIRPYTAVPKSISGKGKSSKGTETTLLIKIYEDGMFTSKLADIKVGDKILMGIPEGSFDLQKVQDAVSITLFAAGTGLTPMLGIIRYCLVEKYLEIRRIKLLFFNKTEKDITLRDEFAKLADKFPNNFEVTHILSSASSSWKGKTGRITAELVKEVVPNIEIENDDLADDEKLLCACGPKPFTDLTVQILKKFNVSNSCIHPFSG